MTDNTDSDALEPCPFCNVKLEDYRLVGKFAEIIRYASHPNNGCILANLIVQKPDYEIWNTRAALRTPAPVEDMREAVIKECAKVADEYYMKSGNSEYVPACRDIAKAIRALTPPAQEQR